MKTNADIKPLLEGYRVLDLTTDGLGLSGLLLRDLGVSVLKPKINGSHSSLASEPVEGIQTIEIDPAGGPWVPDVLEKTGRIDAVLIELPRDDGLTSANVIEAFEAYGDAPLVVECSFHGRSGNDQPPLNELLLQAASSIMAHTGDPERGACRLGGQFAQTMVSLEAASAIVMGLYAGDRERAQGVLRLNAIAVLVGCCFHRRLAPHSHKELGFFGSGIRRNGRRLSLIYDTKDGQIVCPYHPRNMLMRTANWLTEVGQDATTAAAIKSVVSTGVFHAHQHEIEIVESALAKVFAQMTTSDAVNEAQDRGLPAEAVMSLPQVARDPHLEAQRVLRMSDSGELEVGIPYLLTEHKSTDELRGLPGEEQARSLSAPLKGLKVVTFTTMLAGPILAKKLCDLGAEVWRVESPVAEDFTRQSLPIVQLTNGDKVSAVFANVSAGVKSVSLDMGSNEDREVAERLIAEADVLVENMRPGLLGKWGIETERLWQLNSRLIIARLSGMGQTGPRARHRSVGQSMTAVSGQLVLTGWPDKPPVLTDVPAGDFMAPGFGLLTILSALRARSATQSGYQIDYSETAGLFYSVMDEVKASARLDYPLTRLGLRDPLLPGEGAALVTCADDTQIAVVGPIQASRDVAEATTSEEADQWERKMQALVEGLGAKEASSALAERGISHAPFVEPGDLPNQESLLEMGYYGRLRDTVGPDDVLLDGPPLAGVGPSPREYDVSLLGADTEAVLGGLLSTNSNELNAATT